MENDSNWNHRQENDAPQDYTQHPTGARFTPEQVVSNDKYIASKPDKLEAVQNLKAVQNDFENDYPNKNTLQANGRTDSGFSDDNPVMGSENSFESFNDTDPNRYNNNAGLGMPSNHETESELIGKDFLSDDFESNEFDGNRESDNNYPTHTDS